MNLILLRLMRRYVDRRLLQSLLFVAGIALGVAVGVAIDLANGAASRAFSLSVDSVTGRTTHQIVGSSGSVPTSLYRTLRTEVGLRDAAPVIEATVRAETLNGRTFRLLGIDPFAEAPFRSYLTSEALAQADADAGAGLFAFLTEPGAVLISRELAGQAGLAPGDTLSLRTRTRSEAPVRIVGFLAPDEGSADGALNDLILADIATAQEITGEPGALTRIDLILPDDADLNAIESALPPGAALIRTASSRTALAQMTDAFELNLQALSLLALLIGVFLIYNTVTFSVVQRRQMIGILRAVGTTRRQVFTLILAEAVLLGLIGTVIGLALGILLGRGTVSLVAQTVNDLYFRVNVERVVVPPETLLRGLLIGLGASVVAAVIPSLEATRTPPAGVMRRSEVEQQTWRRLPSLTLGALLLIGAGGGVLQIDTRNLVISFAGLFLVLVGGALLTPAALVLVMRLVGPWTGRLFGVLGRMAPRAITRSLSRTSVAVAALTLAVGAIVGVSTMIGSFRGTVSDWLTTTLGADIFVSPFAGETADIPVDVDPAIARRLAQVEGVARVTTVRDVTAIAPNYPELPPANLTVPSDDITRQPRRFAWQNAAGDYWDALRAGQVVVSEPFAFRRGITPDNAQITLLTDRGPHTFEVAGVYYDYTTDQGSVMIAREVYDRYWDDPYLSALALDLAPGVSAERVLDTLQTETLPGTGLRAQSNRSLRAGALEVFDRTFAITVALRLLATIVAFIGILSALLALQLEHTREYAVMRANGMTPRQLRAYTLLQTGLMGAVAGLLALPLGIALAVILIEVINVRSFGWSMDLALGGQEVVQALAVALGAALLAGVYPAWRLSRLVTAQALRSD